VRWPFILEGVVQGFAGAFLAAGLVNLAYSYVIPGVEKAIPFLPLLGPQEIFTLISLPLLAVGICVGALGSLISINRFLKV
jgi:cell division transport system permease protein